MISLITLQPLITLSRFRELDGVKRGCTESGNQVSEKKTEKEKSGNTFSNLRTGKPTDSRKSKHIEETGLL